jgi:hypothetical protein
LLSFVAADDIDGIAAHAHARPGDHAAVDGVAYGDVSTVRALGAHIALGGESGPEVSLGLRGCDERALRN